MTHNEIMAEIEAALRGHEDPEDALTCEELCVALGIDEAAVRRRLKKLSRAGRLQVVQKEGVRVDGRPCLKPAYRVLAGEP